MSIPVLIDSRKPGASSWTIVHETARMLQVSGLSFTDRVKIVLWLKKPAPDGSKEAEMVLNGVNNVYAIDHEAIFAVRAEHQVASGCSVNVSLAR